MAFQQPIQRPVRRAATPPPITTTTAQAPKRIQQVEESQEWVLFSPSPPSEQQAQPQPHSALFTETPVTPRTLPKSRLSDFGSLDSAAVSQRHRDRREEETAIAEDEDDEDEADSLDDGLHAFNEPTSTSNPSAHHCLDSSIADAVLPTHDGLGAFNGSSGPVQQQLWQHEKYNPRRAARGSLSLRRSEVQKRLDALHEEDQTATPRDPAEERNRRIEIWRLDQSRAIVDEIERETRRRRRGSKLSQSSIPRPDLEDTATDKENIRPSTEQPPVQLESVPGQSSPSLWSRTRKAIRELIGIDDATLTYIFGEATSSASAIAQHNAVTPSTPAEMIAYAERTIPPSLDLLKTNSWENNLVARIARELGTLVHQLSEHPPSTFNTYTRLQETVPYAGLPTPAEVSTPAGFLQFNLSATSSRPTHHFKHRRRTSVARTDPSLFGIEEEQEEDNNLTPQQSRNHHVPSQGEDAQCLRQEKDYWEQDLDINMIFSYIKSRLQRRSLTPRSVHTPQSTAPTSSSATASGPDALRRAALIRHHHPLVSRNINALRMSSQSNLNTQASQMPTTPLSPILGRRNSSVIDDGSSCATQSTKRSKTRHSGSLSISSSHNYWDIGGPSWGEV